MTPYSYNEVFTPDEINIWQEVVDVVNLIPDRSQLYEWTRCHEVARIVAALYPDELYYEDGEYTLGLTHSWCRFKDPDTHYNQMGRRIVILDTYAFHQLPAVQLVNVGSMINNPYIRGKVREDIEWSFVEATVEMIREQLNFCG